MTEVSVKIPEDLDVELGKVPKENWQLLFSRFLKKELEELKKVESIVSKSKANNKQVKELADEASLAIAKRLLKK
jgi:hypothetical protein